MHNGFDVGTDDGASGAAFLQQLSGTTAASFDEVDASATFTVDEAGVFTLWARLWAPDGQSDAIYVGLNEEARRIYPTVHGDFQWREVGSYELEAGDHVLTIARGEAGVRLDVLALTLDPRVMPHNLDDFLGVVSHGAPRADAPSAPSIPDAPDEPGTSDAPDEPGTPGEPDRPAAPKPSTGDRDGSSRGSMSVRGDPSFSRSDLSSDARVWYDRVWEALEHSSPEVNANDVAKNDDAYNLARVLFLENQARILALRATGDLRFLDEIDQNAQNMRKLLYDGWCGGVSSNVDVGSYGTIKEKDGYLNFRRRGGSTSSDRSYCRDVADLEETLLHGHIAMLLNAYNVNRDLPSPAGIDYGERADFWLDYLVNHFEAKWRERSDVKFPRMDFIDAKFCHTYNQFNMYYYYVGKTLLDRGDSDGHEYLAYARDMTDQMFETPYIAGKQPGGFVNTSTPQGTAVVYSFGAPGRDGSKGATNMEACPTTYVRYAIPSQLEMHFEGFHRWGDSIMTKIANGISYFVMDTDRVSSRSQTLAAGVTGSKTVEGIPETEYRDRLTLYKYASSTMAALALWDDSGKIGKLNEQIYDVLEGNEDEPRRVQMAASALALAQLR